MTYPWDNTATINNKWLGIEDFNYAYTNRLLDGREWIPDLIHLHNVSSNFFDLSSLAFLSHRVPVVITLHDGWFLTGHCAYPIDCDRWRTGCGNCPDLRRMPSIRRDNTHANWLRKKSIYSQSRLFVGAPSKWLMGMAQASILSAKETRVINNGIDLNVFNPGNKATARKKLGLPQDSFMCIYVAATGSKHDAYKDFSTIIKSIDQLRSFHKSTDILFVCVGGRSHKKSNNQIRYVDYLADPEELAQYYRASDVFLHAANAETFGLTLIESQACGTAVVATEVGGIPETIQKGKTGLLVPHQGVNEMAGATIQLLKNKNRCADMGRNAAIWAKDNFDAKKHATQYLEWYDEILRKWEK